MSNCTYFTISNLRNIYEIGNRKLRKEIEFAYTKFNNSKKSYDAYFGCRVVTAMKHSKNEFVIKTNKIDSKTIIIFGDSKNPDDYFFGKDFLNLKSFEPIAIEINTLTKLLGQPHVTDISTALTGKFNVYQLIRKNDKNGEMKTTGYFTRHVPGDNGGSINLGVFKTSSWNDEDWSKSQLYWLPSSNLIDNSLICSKTESCFYTTDRPANLKRHEKGCTDVQEIISKQNEYGSNNDEVEKLSNILNIDYSRFRQQHICCYDIETFENGRILIPVSIAVASTLDKPRYFEKLDDTPEASYQMVVDFMVYLLELHQKLQSSLPAEIDHAIEYLQAQKEGLLSPNYRSRFEFNQIYNYFKNYQALKVFGFNSRYVRTDVRVRDYLSKFTCSHVQLHMSICPSPCPSPRT